MKHIPLFLRLYLARRWYERERKSRITYIDKYVLSKYGKQADYATVEFINRDARKEARTRYHLTPEQFRP